MNTDDMVEPMKMNGRQQAAPEHMKPTPQDHELISALVDGQLSGDDFARALVVCEDDEKALASWSAYHLIGDVLRSSELTVHAGDAAFLTRLRARLDQEAVPARPVQGAAVAAAGPVHALEEPASANDGSYRWKLVAGFASMAAVAAVAWNAGAGLLAPVVAPQLARSETPAASQQVLVVSEQGTMVRDARMQELLAAHKQFGGTSALQMPSGFLRNATFEAPPADRR